MTKPFLIISLLFIGLVAGAQQISDQSTHATAFEL